MPGDKRSTKSRRTSSSDTKNSRSKAKPAPPDIDEEVIDRGNAMSGHAPQSSTEVANRVGSRRQRDTADGPVGVRATDAGCFFDDLLKKLEGLDECSHFVKPVFEMWSKKSLPGYTDKIKTPMDLRTVRERFESGAYALPLNLSSRPGPSDKHLFIFDEQAMASDIRLIFTNAMTYNEEKSDIYTTSKKILQLVDDSIQARKQKLARHAERMKRDAERKRRRLAEVAAAEATAVTARTVAELRAAKREAEEAEKRRKADLERVEAEWKAKLERAKQKAVQEALRSAAASNGAVAAGALPPMSAITLSEHANVNALACSDDVATNIGAGLVTPNALPQTTAPGLRMQQVAIPAQPALPPQQLVPSIVDGTPVQVPQPNAQHLQQQQLQLQQQGLVPGSLQPLGMHQPNFSNGAMHPPGVPHGIPSAQPGLTIPKAATSSVSSDESDTATVLPEITFAFVSTVGLEKKRGRKSAQVMELEVKHDAYMRRRRVLVDLTLELERSKQMLMPVEEKMQLCNDIAKLDFVRMKAVVDIIALGTNEPSLLKEVDVEVDVNSISDVILREIQYFIASPACMTLREELRSIEAKIATIEAELVKIRFQKVAS